MNMKKYIVPTVAVLAIGLTTMISQGMEKNCIAATAAIAEQVPAFVEVQPIAEDMEASQPESALVPEDEPEPESKPQLESEETYRKGLAAYITSVNHTVTTREALSMVDSVLEQAENYDIDEKLILAVAHTESTYYSDAVSCADYKGLMQTGDVLAEAAGYEPEELFDPDVSIRVGAGYINDQLETFDDDVSLALTAYNQGPGAVYAGSYDMDYAELTIERVQKIENFLLSEGYAQP